MQRDCVAAPSFWTVDRVIDWMRESDDLPDEFHEIFAVDPRHRLVDAAPQCSAMRNPRHARIADIMTLDLRPIPAAMDRADVADCSSATTSPPRRRWGGTAACSAGSPTTTSSTSCARRRKRTFTASAA